MGRDTGSAELSDQRDYDDRDQLAKLGKKEVLKVCRALLSAAVTTG